MISPVVNISNTGVASAVKKCPPRTGKVPTSVRKRGVLGTMKDDVSGRTAARATRDDETSGLRRARGVTSYRVAKAPIATGVLFNVGDAQV